MRVRVGALPAGEWHKKNALHGARFSFWQGGADDGCRLLLPHYFRTAATALATTSRLRVFSAATQIRPVPTA